MSMKQDTQKQGKQVLDVKGQDVPQIKSENRIQVHQGNVPALTVHFLSKISESLERIANKLEKA